MDLGSLGPVECMRSFKGILALSVLRCRPMDSKVLGTAGEDSGRRHRPFGRRLPDRARMTAPPDARPDRSAVTRPGCRVLRQAPRGRPAPLRAAELYGRCADLAAIVPPEAGGRLTGRPDGALPLRLRLWRRRRFRHGLRPRLGNRPGKWFRVRPGRWLRWLGPRHLSNRADAAAGHDLHCLLS